jgi:adenylate cyclase, class 2
MHSAEIELKFPVVSLVDLERRLTDLGFRLDTPRTFESNTLYDTPDRTLKQKGELLRIREYGVRHIVTHKRHPEDEDPASKYKVRIETESEVSDGAALAEIFVRLGFEPAFRYEKYRREYSHPSASAGHVVVDETPIGIYAELEGPPGWIDQTLVALGVNLANCLTESYGRLFTAWKKRTGSEAENLTFEEVRENELAAVGP